MWNRIKLGARETVGYFIGELKLIFSDSGAVLFFMLAMVIYPLLYITAYEKETARELPVAIVDYDHTSTSRQYGRMLDATEQIKVLCKPTDLLNAKQLFYDGKVKGVVLIPDGFEKDILASKQTSVTVYSDASFFLLYKQVYSGASFATGTLSAGIEIKRMLAEGKNLNQAMDLQDPVKVDVYNLYNPSGGYASFVMPGIILIVMQQTLLIGIGVLGGTIREKKIFLKMNGHGKRKFGSSRIVIGKALSYLLIYFLNAFFTFVIFHHWFNLPDKANMLWVFIIFIPFILSLSFLGLAISMLFKERVHAILFLVFLSPALVFMSGISWPAQAVPQGLQWFSFLFPATTAVKAYLKIRLCGAGFDAVKQEFLTLLLMTVVYFGLAVASYKTSINLFLKKLKS